MPFENIIEAAGSFTEYDETSVDTFIPIGDGEVISITTQTGFGEGGFGEGPFGGGITTTIIFPSVTIWTEVTDR